MDCTEDTMSCVLWGLTVIVELCFWVGAGVGFVAGIVCGWLMVMKHNKISKNYILVPTGTYRWMQDELRKAGII